MKTLLLNPFKKYSDQALLLIGVAMTIVGSFMGFYFQARYDGILDLHFGKNTQWQAPLFDNLINISALTILLFALGKYLNKKTRFVDILSAVMIARIPFYLMTLNNINGFMAKSGEKLHDLLIPQGSNIPVLTPQEMLQIINDNIGFILIASLTGILMLIWFVVLLYNGFKVASNAKGIKPVILFSAVILIAEIISKLIIYSL